MLESAYSKFKDLSINIGKEEAKKQIEAIYGSQALKLGVDIVYDKQAIVDNYNKAAKELETRTQGKLPNCPLKFMLKQPRR